MAEAAENNEEQDEYSKLTGTQKCAILMMLLGEEEASEILRNLGTYLLTYTPLAFKHAAEKQVSNAHFKREFTFILTCSLFYDMDLVAPGPIFSCQGRGKVPRGSGTTCAKRACCIYLLNTNKR